MGKWRRYRRYLPSILCAVAGLVSCTVLTLIQPEDSAIQRGQIRREGYGGAEKEYELMVGGMESQEIPVTVTVKPRIYTKEEAEQVFYEIMDGMEERIRVENPSLMQVASDLKLPSHIEGMGVQLRWRSSNPELLSSAGRLIEAVKVEQAITLYVELSNGTNRADFEIPVLLTPRTRTPRQAQWEGLEETIRKCDEEQRMEECLSLPMEYEGQPLSYRAMEESSYTALPFIGFVLAVLLLFRERTARREREKKREQELLSDYAELVSKLMVLVGAGLTVRSAWERMVRDYEAARSAGKQKERAAYEEMRQTYYQFSNGMTEGAAYREFGYRCCLQPYLKLSSLLEQNRKSGAKYLRAILQKEMQDAFEMRKNLARKLGEEAGTKLLLPLFLMLLVVMIIIMAPAMMTMG